MNVDIQGYFGEQFGVSSEMIRAVMGAALGRGGDFADLYFEHQTGLSVGFEDAKVNRAHSGISLGVGIRVVQGDQTGYAFTEELTKERMLEAAKTAAGIASHGQPSMPSDYQNQSYVPRYNTNYDWAEVQIADVRPLLERIHEKTMAAEPRIVRLTQSFGGGQSTILHVRSDGRVSADRQPMTRYSLNLTLEKDGVRQANGANIAAREGMEFYTPERVDGLITKALDQTRILFESGRPPAGEMPVVLAAGSAGILLHEAIGHGMEADFNRKGISIFSDKIGKRVAMDDVTIVDDGTPPNARGAINFDDEGEPSQTTNLVENGILRTYLHDRISAKHYGVEPTGSGRRESFRHQPMPRMRCTYMKSGSEPKEDLIRSVKKGVYCVSFTNGQVQIGAGDYAFYVKNGYLIEDGKLTQPIKDVNIIGNGPESLERITKVADDFEMDEGGWTCGKGGQSVPVSIGMPTLLVSGIVVGGKAT